MPTVLRSMMLVAFLPLVMAATCTRNDGGAAAGGCSTQKGPQGWTECERFAWYENSQGSRLIPQAWLHALEQPAGTGKFLDASYIATFNYLPPPVPPAGVGTGGACPIDPALPLGFVVDCQSDADLKITHLRWKVPQGDQEPWVGMNCSACHTAQMEYKAPGQTQASVIRIDGGPTLADFQSFTEALDQALINTAAETPEGQAKFARFAAGVLGDANTPANQAALRAALGQRIAWNHDLAALNGDPHLDKSPLEYGFGRLDAVGHIFNKVALLGMPDDAIDQTVNPADAPVSYPFLWNVPQQNKVEWDGLAANKPPKFPITFDYGALGRNTGEVIGVFGDVVVKPGAGKLEGYVSSINEPILQGMEERIGTLLPPVWPAAFGPIDPVKQAAGKALFTARHCDSCHSVPAVPVNLQERYTVALSRVFKNAPDDRNFVGTDMWMACNVALDMAKSGAYAGSPAAFLAGNPIGKTAYAHDLTTNAVAGVLVGKKGDLIATELEGLFGIYRGLPIPSRAQRPGETAKQLRADACMDYVDDPANPLMVYKGRPLQGIWATAPYLHNGSVPSLYDLLLPPAQRPTQFAIGTRLYDPVRGGFSTDPAAPGNVGVFRVNDASGAPIAGNSNAGHDYGNASLSEADRAALVAYMESL